MAHVALLEVGVSHVGFDELEFLGAGVFWPTQRVPADVVLQQGRVELLPLIRQTVLKCCQID